MKNSNNKLLISAIIIIALIAFNCGDKKTDTSDTKKQENVTQQQTQTDQNQTTEKKDTLKPKTEDTTKTTETEPDVVIMKTSMGDMEIELYPKDAPKHVANFKKLVREKFYDGTAFHRVIPGFMIQGGDPNSKNDDRSDDGKGGPGYTIPAEIKLKHERGSLAAARLGDQVNPRRESSGSQFYIVTGDASHLDGQYTVFGKVIKGYDVALKIEKVDRDGADNPLKKVVIEKVYFKK